MKLLTVRLDQVEPSERNVRQELGDLTELADSIRARGLLEPPQVVQVAPDRYRVRDGHRRRAACELAELTEIPILVDEDADPDSRPDELLDMLIAGLTGVNLTPVEEAAAYQELISFPGWNEKQIAARVGRSRGTVRARLKLATLDTEVRDELQAGQLTLAQAEALIEFTGTRWADNLREAAGGSNWEWALASARRHREADRRAAKTRKGLAAAGITVANDLPTPHRWVRLAELVDADSGQPVDAAAHQADCPGHAACINHNGEPEPVCAEPDTYGHTDRWGYRRAQSAAAYRAERERTEAEHAQLAADLATASELRRAHLRTVLSCRVTRPRLLDSGVGSLLVGTVCDLTGTAPYLDGENADAALELLDATTTTAGVDPRDERVEPAERLAFVAADRPLQALTALIATAYETELTNSPPSVRAAFADQPCRDYLTWLQATGYQLSPFEAGMLDGHADPEDATDDDGVDECDTPASAIHESVTAEENP